MPVLPTMDVAPTETPQQFATLIPALEKQSTQWVYKYAELLKSETRLPAEFIFGRNGPLSDAEAMQGDNAMTILDQYVP